MGVYIANMEKPKECGDCNFVQAFWDDKRWLFRCLVTDKIAKDCPLIEIPTPHGRLIDRDDIYIGRWDIDSDLAEQIQNAPTILEEEK